MTLSSPSAVTVHDHRHVLRDAGHVWNQLGGAGGALMLVANAIGGHKLISQALNGHDLSLFLTGELVNFGDKTVGKLLRVFLSATLVVFGNKLFLGELIK